MSNLNVNRRKAMKNDKIGFEDLYFPLAFIFGQLAIAVIVTSISA